MAGGIYDQGVCMDTLQEEIAKVAYELYEKRGRGPGCHLDDWLEAERIVRARHAGTSKVAVKPRKVEKRKAPEGKEAAPETAVPRKKRIGAKKTAPKKTV